jgi:hypothetical protein
MQKYKKIFYIQLVTILFYFETQIKSI